MKLTKRNNTSYFWGSFALLVSFSDFQFMVTLRLLSYSLPKDSTNWSYFLLQSHKLTQYCACFIQSPMSGSWSRKFFLASISVFLCPLKFWFILCRFIYHSRQRIKLCSQIWNCLLAPPCLETDRSCWWTQQRIFFPLELFVQNAILYIRLSIKPKLLSSCIIMIGILNKTLERYLILVMMCLHRLLNLNPLNIFWALKCTFVLILSFEHILRKCTEDISWHRRLEFQ